MKSKTSIICTLSVCMTLMLMTGCASSPPPMKKSGFLGDYSKLQQGPDGGADYRYIRPNVDFSVYDKIMMDQVEFRFDEGAAYKGIQPDELKKLADAFHKAMVEALQDSYPFVKESGPGVMRVRTAITDVVPSKPTLNTITTIVPVGLAISSIRKATTGVHANVGQAAMEVEILDAQTGEPLATAVDREVGGKFDLVDGMTKWGHAEHIFEFWAKRMREWLDSVH
ncbi:DUF3313 domain-containing protein [Desulfonema ishimotonii]|uniref:DUF3313 domain-containing protein n=1 Tax=Desulfonema ishimotonii TaxID=45657 RepID=A0A401G319_9BACT|nr:DUF3313 domain-containing protein [Desulfonema ishimotonii]GBC63642.1 DUF3313 domain-containing protein [Desulfonema ishimotonii]